jgi:hypothetical protein
VPLRRERYYITRDFGDEDVSGAASVSHRPRHHTVTTGAGRSAEPLADNAFVDYFRCPAESAALDWDREYSTREGFFAFGDATAYGHANGVAVKSEAGGELVDAMPFVETRGNTVRLPFDLSAIVRNLREERYCQDARLNTATLTAAIKHLYYFVRPVLPVAVRKHLQRHHLSGWEDIAFPQWPIDFSVDLLMTQTMRLLLKSNGNVPIPFIWFWPDGASSAAIVTHDVEGPDGRDFCSELMDLDDSFGIKASFQIIPELRGAVTDDLIELIRGRGFEVNLHDLNHDGFLFHDKTLFLQRAEQINKYARQRNCRGFRSGAMYREQAWFEAFDFSYDMSVPNAAHLEPQRGGCCSVMPYFVGRILELPLTTLQDYSLFHILGDYSTELWTLQIGQLVARHGLITLLTHPDYLIDSRARTVYSDLLTHISSLRDRKGTWVALPGEVNDWWRDRHQMVIRREERKWRISGPSSDRARLAIACLQDDQVVYRLEGAGDR